MDYPITSVIFTDAYFGLGNASNSYIVEDGYLAYFPVSNTPLDYVNWTSPFGYLRGPTNINSSPTISRLTSLKNFIYNASAEWDTCLSKSTFDTFWFCVW
jgi:hypothetical protein